MPSVTDILFKNRALIGSCWIWTGAVTSGGYGQIKSRQLGLRDKAVHRVSYVQHKGPIPPDGLICHSCDTRRCFNPEHLFLSDHKGNTEDMLRKGRSGRPGLKLTDDEVAEIIGNTRPQPIIAKEYGITQQHVSKIKTGRRRNY